MKILNMLGTKVLAVALALSILPTALPSTTPLVGVSKAEAQERHYGHGDIYRRHHFDEGRRFDRRYDGDRRYYGRDRYYGRRNTNGAAIAGAIVGLGIGAAIANSAQPRSYRPAPRYYGAPVYANRGYSVRSPEWYDYCASRYRSFDPRSGTFQPNNGPRRLCR